MGGHTALDSAQQCLGIALPLTPNWVAANDVSVVWQAFDEWLLLTTDGEQAPLRERLRAALADRHAVVTDVTDLYAVFEVSGPRGADLIAKGCALDLHPRAFGEKGCAPTALARVRVTLRKLDAAPTWQVLVERSYAQYLRDWLVDAAIEFTAGS